MPNALTLGILAIGFVILHVVWFATDYHPLAERVVTYLRPQWVPVYALEVLLVWSQLLQSVFFPIPHTPADTGLTVLGLMLFAAGCVLAVWAKLAMRQYWGLPGEADAKRQTALVTTGPFVHSRNPIYVGLFGVVFGLSLAVRSPLIVLDIALFAYFQAVIRKEEAHLTERFGNKYRDYCRRVPRFL